MLMALYFHPPLHFVTFYQKSHQRSRPLAMFAACLHTGVWVTGGRNFCHWAPGCSFHQFSESGWLSESMLIFGCCVLCSQEPGSAPSGLGALIPRTPACIYFPVSLPYFGYPSLIYDLDTHVILRVAPPQRSFLLLPYPPPQTQGCPYLLRPIHIKLKVIT